MMMNVSVDADTVRAKLPNMIDDKEEEPTKLELTITSEKTKTKRSQNIEADEGETSSSEIVVDDEETQRYLPKNKKPDAALTFPEKVRLTIWRMLSTGEPDRK
jgi:hypothetical protein